MKKFLLSMIFCCATPSSRPTIRHHRTFTSRSTEEVRALMRQSSTASERTITRSTSTTSSIRRSSRGGGGGGGGGGGKLSGIGSKSMSAATQWKPSLCAISEDRVVYVVAGNGGERTTPTTTIQKKLAGKTSIQNKAKIRARDFNDNEFIRRSPSMNIIPAFSPTVFLF